MASVRVTLAVTRPVPAGISVWVVYGPPAPWFGLVRMRPASNSLYVATVHLPAGSRARFTFLTGHGAVRTPTGAIPGRPVTAIRQLPPRTVSTRRLPTVRWSGPTG